MTINEMRALSKKFELALVSRLEKHDMIKLARELVKMSDEEWALFVISGFKYYKGVPKYPHASVGN